MVNCILKDTPVRILSNVLNIASQKYIMHTIQIIITYNYLSIDVQASILSNCRIVCNRTVFPESGDSVE